MTDISLTTTVGFAPTSLTTGRERTRSQTTVAPAVRIALLRQHGTHSQAFSATFQAGLEHFGDERGFLAYKTVGGTALVMSDPIAAPGNIPDLISRFLQQHPDACFWYLSPAVAKVLAARGFYVNSMGYDTSIDLTTYDFNGPKKKPLREGYNRMVKRGYVTRECTLAEVGIDKIKALSEAWRLTRPIRFKEVCFLNRPLVVAEEPDVRRFFTFDRSGKLVAFGFFEPVYEGGKVVGYTSQHNRHLPEADCMVHFAIKRVAIETFQKEGLKVLHLGLAPFADVLEDEELKASRHWLTALFFNFAYKNSLVNRFVYSNKGIEAHRRVYRGVQRQNYYAFKGPAWRVVKGLRACNII